MTKLHVSKMFEDVIFNSHQSFALVCRNHEENVGNVDFIYGREKVLSSIDEIDALISPDRGTKGCFLLAPYRQIRERGFDVIEDDTPLVAIDIEARVEIPVDEVLLNLTNKKVSVKHSGFSESDDEYKAKVTNIINEEIGTGQGANFVIKRSLKGEFEEFSIDTMLSIFRALLTQEMGAYWTFIVRTDSHLLVGASPERHISLKDKMVSMMPISGTYRYPSSGPTQEGLTQFLEDKKEEGELYMVLDEELKTMTDICSEDVNVDGPFLFPMSKLLHTGYTIHGRSHLPVSSILKKSMFAPTVTGSPIENAARVIVKYEPDGRSYYSGFAALISAENSQPEIDSCILIRTVESDKFGAFSLSVGATLVRNSDPVSELEETKAKVASLKDAMGMNKNQPFYEERRISQLLDSKNTRIAKFWRQRNNYHSSLLAHKSVVILDNEDSFTSMMAYQLKQMDFKVRLISYSDTTEILDHEIIVVGPGPGDPRDMNDPRVRKSLDVIKHAIRKNQPIIAICFGHQLLCQVLGLEIESLEIPNQGLQKEIRFFGTQETVGFYNTFTAVYDKSAESLSRNFDVAFDQSSGHVFGIRGERFSSMQFHPESVLTLDGSRIIYESIASAVQI
ncbi:phenazine antibiotic biosynthesis protein [Vibrio sp. vnigr-6D03]|uniref:anthranilate synthase family protein n=1 Tax=Vibrio sp. vnigr-6D03 TaxID=2058088 RepID=UPI000C33AA98|nr:anthranilate synthase family protein [Vibrio sp. vnigr-6D03]PKF80047.1 phenazine antibiotic biosynthesis protein [Vibrio sp. vnigr-6D03]